MRPSLMFVSKPRCIGCELCSEIAPVFAAHLSTVEVSDETLDAMGECPTGAIRWCESKGESNMQTLDVRTIIPRERHPLIFAKFDELGSGEAFELLNDHDPKPLYYQFQAERAGQLDWTYLEEGPEVWRVRIGKV